MKITVFIIIAASFFVYMISCPNIATFETCIPTYSWQFTSGKQMDYYSYSSLIFFSCLLSFFTTFIIFSLSSYLHDKFKRWISPNLRTSLEWMDEYVSFENGKWIARDNKMGVKIGEFETRLEAECALILYIRH